MATPFSPFVGKIKKPEFRRRQSQLPSDLIDWDAPEIPEFEKQRIIYEDYIQEITEDNDINTIINEQIFKVAHYAIVEEYSAKTKKLEEEVKEEKSRVHLFLGQIKMFESNVKEDLERIEDLENEVASQRNTIINLEQEKENWMEERNNLQVEIEDLNFRNNEIACERNHNHEIYLQKKAEAEDYRKKLEAIKNQLSHYKRLAKNKQINEDEN